MADTFGNAVDRRPNAERDGDRVTAFTWDPRGAEHSHAGARHSIGFMAGRR